MKQRIPSMTTVSSHVLSMNMLSLLLLLLLLEFVVVGEEKSDMMIMNETVCLM